MTDMNDLEMTRLCAEAMGHKVVDSFEEVEPPVRGIECLGDFLALKDAYQFRYDPLHDDAQAFALLVRFRLWVGGWIHDNFVSVSKGGESLSTGETLNRAICECVAKMHSNLTGKSGGFI